MWIDNKADDDDDKDGDGESETLQSYISFNWYFDDRLLPKSHFICFSLERRPNDWVMPRLLEILEIDVIHVANTEVLRFLRFLKDAAWKLRVAWIAVERDF